MDGVQLPQGYSHFEEAVYFLPFSAAVLSVLRHFYSENDVAQDMLTQFVKVFKH